MLDSLFLFRDGAPTLLLIGAYSPALVALSVLVASLTSALALQIAGMAGRTEAGLNRHLILISGATAMGGGVWSMHFIGMLAFQLCAKVEFDTGITVLSMLPSVLASWVALALLARGSMSRWHWVIGGVLVGAGIGAMHYTGMAAMELRASLRYDPWWFAASIVVAVLLAMVALWIRFGLEGKLSRGRVILLGGTVMGFAISGMHYTAMGAARFIGGPDELCAYERNGSMALGVTIVTLLISALTAGLNGLFRYRRLAGALRTSEEQYRSLIANSPGVNYRCTADAVWSVQLISDSVQTLTGWPAEDFLQGRRTLAELMHPDELQRAVDLLKQGMRENRPATVEYRLRHRNGSERWVSATSRGLVDGVGKLRWVDGVILDITEAKKLQLALEEAKEKAEQAAAVKTAFLANMSHEIRTPMNAILGFTELLLDTSLTAAQRKHLSTVRGSARSLLGLLNDILDTAKLDKGALHLEQRNFSLRAVCEQTLASLRLSADRKGLALQLDYAGNAPQHFVGDALRVQQVLVNLIGNAIKFTERGAVTLCMAHEQNHIHLTVIDTGIGIPADRLERIFDAFAQADASTTRRFGGTGLGTTISRQLVESMGGRITVESEPDQGSRFHIWLPLPMGEAAEAEADEPATQLPPQRLLVADDLAQNAELLLLLLSRDGHRVRIAADGLQAVRALAEEDFDLVLMDVHMPELDGLGATRRIRAAELSQDRVRTPIIALTASVLEEDRQAALAAGMDGFATKPVEIERLRAEMARVLGLALAPGKYGKATYAAGSSSDDCGEAIDCERGLKLWGNAASWRRALRRFADEQREGALRLTGLLQDQNWLDARALAHRWRGVAGSLALPRLLAACVPLEEALRQGRRDDLSPLAQVLGTALDEALTGIDELSGDTEPAGLDEAPAKPATGDHRAALDRLAKTLARGELDDEGLAAAAASFGAARCQPLIHAVDQFDFEAALKTLAALRAAA